MVKLIIEIILISGIGFIAYFLGRIGDRYGGHLEGIHHWIYGAILMVIGFGFISPVTHPYWYIVFVASGAGAFISDLNDFFHLRIFGPDEKETNNFWDFD